MAHTDNIAEVVTGRFANTGDVGGTKVTHTGENLEA